MWLDGNNLSGSIPPELGNLTSLEGLAVSNNDLSGTLPQELTKLTELEKFYFADNAGLCAPADQTFQTWLQAIPNRSGDTCDETTTSTSTAPSAPSGEPPIAEAGPDQYVRSGDLVTLNGAAAARCDLRLVHEVLS